uniref:ABC transporter B family member 1 n=1 Tax=Euplotes crassus TaxID=5936 RepID=A0A1S5RRS8_EUPCR|nr:ABC transporter B family member 1 [Moneuplotes crassus]
MDFNEDDDGLNYDKDTPMVGFFEMFKFSTFKIKIYLVLGIISAILAGIAMPLFVIFIEELYNSFDPDTSVKTTYDNCFKILLYLIYIGIGLWFVSYLYLAFFGMVSEYTGMIYRVKYLESVLKQDISWFENNDPQSLASKISKEASAIQIATGEKAANIFFAFTMLIAGAVVSFTMGWKFAFVTVALFPLLFLVLYFMILVLQMGFKKQEQAFKASSTLAEQALNSIKVVQAYGQEEKEDERFCEPLEEARKSGIKYHYISSLAYGMNNGIFMLIFALALFFGALFVTEGIKNDIRDRDYTPGDIIAVFFGMMFAAFSLSLAGPNFKSVTKGRQAAYAALQTIERVPNIIIDDEAAKRIDNIRGEIKFENVKFKYKTRKINALDGVTINFEQGKITALVGPSGSGKSTIVQLMERFYDPDEGSVLVDGEDLRNINLRDFRSKVGYVGQEPVLFNQTIRENLYYGNPEATEDDMLEACKKANAAKIIERLPEGLDTIVGAQGGQLSGGERQRIALARAFIKDPKILILDEATSALDRKNEQEVQEAIDNLKNGDLNITTIVIAHRLSTIRYSDKIVVLKEGKVVEEGNHKELLKNYKGGVYSTLVAKQEKLDDDQGEGDGNSDESADHKKRVHKTSTMRKNTSFNEEIKSKKEEADALDEDIKKEKDELIAQIKKKGYFKRLLEYNKPYWLIIVGLISSGIQGMTMPVFAVFYVKILFAMFEEDLELIAWYCFGMACNCFLSCTATYFQKLSFGILSENMTKSIRRDLYKAILKKHAGWFDLPENNIGVLTSTLTSDVYALNGASTEGLSTVIETWIGLIGGLTMGLIFEWRIALSALCVIPFFICSAVIQVQLQTGFTESQEGSLKKANLLLSDAISNYKTVASFGHEYLLTDILRKNLQEPLRKGAIKSHLAGFVFGWSNFVQNVVMGLLFFLGAVYIRYDGADQENCFLAIFVLMFAAWGAGQAQQFGPSQGKAFKSAIRIFSIIDEPSEIDASENSSELVMADDKTFNGKIEFRNVWFRYPTRADSWILKDFSLTILPHEKIGLVGESGSGKSTIVQLILRFYEPHFGQILINGVDIKHYNLKSLRQQMGLVQQMPTLFNDSVLFNICYGENEQDVNRAIEASGISNAKGFISRLTDAKGDDNVAIEEHEEVDEDNVDVEDLKKGLKTGCGTNGGKLSGGQKQRVAIARAVIRQPNILLLDEATSALDEVSQGKVQEALEKIMEGRTSIVIAHRLTTIENCDRIVLLKNGKIYKQGKYNEIKDDL